MSADDRAVIGRRGLSGRWLATLQCLDSLVELLDAEIDRHLPQRVRPVMVRRRLDRPFIRKDGKLTNMPCLTLSVSPAVTIVTGSREVIIAPEASNSSMCLRRA